MRQRAGWALFAAVTLAAGAGLSLNVRSGNTILGNAFSPLAGVAFSFVGAILVTHQRRNTIGWVFLGIGFFEAAAYASGQYATHGSPSGPGTLPAAAGAKWLSEFVWIPAFAGITTLLPLLFPDGRPPSMRWTPVLWGVLAALGGVLAASILTFDRRDELFDGPVSSQGIADTVGGASMALLAVCAIASIVALLRRYRRSTGTERNQLKWFAFGGCVSLTLILLSRFAQAEEILLLVAIPILPVSATIAIVRHRLYEIDAVISRTAVYSILTGLVFGAFVVSVALADRLSPGNELSASLLTALLIAVLFQPLRQRVQLAVNRRVYGYRDEPYRALRRVGEELDRSESGDALQGIAAGVAESLRLPYAAIVLRSGVTAEFGKPAGDVGEIPLMYRGIPVGALRVSARAATEVLTSGETQLLHDIARHVGIAAHALELTARLQRSRERLVSAREEERRRIRRELHDGLGPALAGMALELQAARSTLVRDADRTARTLSALAEKMSGLIAEVRRIVYGLRPPALDERGLVAAITEQASHLTNLEVTLQATDDMTGLPAAVEVAAYRIAIEAATNASRHAGAERCVIALSRSNGTLDLTITDDGRGVPGEARPGVGMLSMREQAEELGGTCIVRARPEGGTVVTARLRFDGS